MRSLFALVVWCGLSACSPQDAASGDDPLDASSVDSGASEAVPPCDEAHVLAIQAAFADKTVIPNDIGAVALIKDPSCGVRYFTRGVSKDVPQNALHLIGSQTKTFVASLILLLVDEGRLSLADPVTKWIPAVPGGDAVTVAELLHHTSGIYNYTAGVSFLLGATFHSKYTPRALLDLGFGVAPSFAPGEPGKWEYSNTGYVLLAMIAESTTGKTITQALHEPILTPIGASATLFNGYEPITGNIAYGPSSEQTAPRTWTRVLCGAAATWSRRSAMSSTGRRSGAAARSSPRRYKPSSFAACRPARPTPTAPPRSSFARFRRS